MDSIIFKIVEYYQDTGQIVVKFCKKTSQKSIDKFSPISIDLKNLDMSSVNSFCHSLLQYGIHYVNQIEESVPMHPSNVCNQNEVPNSLDDINKFLNIPVSVDSQTYPSNFDYLEKIDL
jgi:hypothetical protein